MVLEINPMPVMLSRLLSSGKKKNFSGTESPVEESQVPIIKAEPYCSLFFDTLHRNWLSIYGKLATARQHSWLLSL